MTPEQFRLLKEYIQAVALYEAARVTDDHAPYSHLNAAEKALDQAFESISVSTREPQ